MKVDSLVIESAVFEAAKRGESLAAPEVAQKVAT
jgi:hypothetical protein